MREKKPSYGLTRCAKRPNLKEYDKINLYSCNITGRRPIFAAINRFVDTTISHNMNRPTAYNNLLVLPINFHINSSVSYYYFFVFPIVRLLDFNSLFLVIILCLLSILLITINGWKNKIFRLPCYSPTMFFLSPSFISSPATVWWAVWNARPISLYVCVVTYYPGSR